MNVPMGDEEAVPKVIDDPLVVVLHDSALDAAALSGKPVVQSSARPILAFNAISMAQPQRQTATL